MKRLRIHKSYFFLFIFLFAIEIIIGTKFHDNLIRPYGGDFLVVIVLYCLIKSFINSPVLKTALGVLLLACLVEVSQYFHLVNTLGFQYSKAARLLLGSQFSFCDLVAYILGTLLTILVENIKTWDLKNEKLFCR